MLSVAGYVAIVVLAWVLVRKGSGGGSLDGGGRSSHDGHHWVGGDAGNDGGGDSGGCD